jgi:Ca2+-binding RTX toxin-like protein
MATNLVRVGSELQVNLYTTGGQTLPDVAALSDGRFLVAYQAAPDSLVVFGQLINAGGSPSGGTLFIESEIEDHENPAVAARPGGAAIVVWEDGNVDLPRPNIQLAVINSAGTNITPGGELDAVVGTSADGFPNQNPDVATFANGQSIIVWERTIDGNDHDINARVLNAPGTGFTTSARIAIDISTSFSRSPAVATSGNKALVVYSDSRNGGNFDVRAVLFDASTGTFGQSIVIADKPATNNLASAEVAALTDGRYIVVYADVNANLLLARFVSAAGNPVGGEITIATNVPNAFPDVAGTPDSGFVAVWNEAGDVHGRRYLGDGTPGGDEFRVNGLADGFQGFPSITINSAGRVFVTFEDGGSRPGDTEPPGIRGGLFQLTTEVINGTLGDDTITTYNLGETINGGPGNDVINAMGGNDTVFGGDHNDTVNGGNGNDNLKGERNVDTLNGGAGNDSLDGGQKKGTLTGGPGLDSFVFNTAVKKGNKQTITDFTPADDTIVLDACKFKKLDPGPLKGKHFFKGSPDDGNDYVGIKGKKVVYDANGDKDGGDTILFVLTNGSKGFGKDDVLVVA